MAGGKETPRQKMIGMMYLVLTALLALNVSKDILNAFVIVEKSMVSTNANFSKKVDNLYTEFSTELVINKDKVQPYYDKALKVKQASDEMVKFIKEIKSILIIETDKLPKEIADKIADGTISPDTISSKDNYDQPTRIMLKYDNQVDESGTSGYATKMKKKLEEYAKTVLAFIDEKDRALIKSPFDFSDKYSNYSKKVQNWEINNFYNTVLVGDLVILSKYIADVKNFEFEIVSKLFQSISAKDFKFDQIEARVVPQSMSVFAGSQYQADIFIAAMDSKTQPEIIVNGQSIKVENGIGKYVAGAAGEGTRKYEGVIKLKSALGERVYPFKSEYSVAKPNLTVAAEKMNVFYAGVTNPVSISVPGVTPDKIRCEISGGQKITPKGAGTYEVFVNNPGQKVTITVFATVDGKPKNMGSKEFRVKAIPDPVARFSGKADGVANRTELENGTIAAVLDNFDFDLSFYIVSFVLETTVGGDLKKVDGSGNRLNENMKAVIKNVKKGQTIQLRDIYAKGPDGKSRRLNPIVLKLN